MATKPIDPISLKILGMIRNRIPDDTSEDPIAMRGAIMGVVRPFGGKTKKTKNSNLVDVHLARYNKG
jgi:hypothetical protein